MRLDFGGACFLPLPSTQVFFTCLFQSCLRLFDSAIRSLCRCRFLPCFLLSDVVFTYRLWHAAMDSLCSGNCPKVCCFVPSHRITCEHRFNKQNDYLFNCMQIVLYGLTNTPLIPIPLLALCMLPLKIPALFRVSTSTENAGHKS